MRELASRFCRSNEFDLESYEFLLMDLSVSVI